MITEKEFPFLAEKGHVVSLVGGGGKTTLLYAMASHCARKGWRVLVSTTTHILQPERCYAPDDPALQALWAAGEYAVAGTPAGNGKLSAPPVQQLQRWMREADAVFLEADGAKRMPCKVPAEHEPVLLPESDAVLAVAGHPILGIPLAMLAGACAGFVTAFLQTHLGVPSILAGIITNTGLYTVNLAIMGFSSNVPMLKTETVFTTARALFGEKSPYKLIVAVTVTVVACALLILFLGTRLGLSIRATGDNPDMVRASSINTAFTITVGLCVSNAMTSLSGAVLAQYQKSADINLGTGMVVIGLASLIIGETLFGRGGMWVKAAAAVAGSVIYRFIIALALRANVPSECLKLISAVIVALAIAAPALKKNLALRRRRAVSQKGGKTHA